MIKVLFVDDEVLAMEYLQNMIDWEKYGFTVVGHARSGKKALELFEKERPQIVISDIKMTGMDGLELAMRLKEKDPSVVVILLSAYRDFEYAQKGFEYGVANYLLKHELCEEKLLTELEKVRGYLEADEKKKKIYHKYFTKQLIYNQEGEDEFNPDELGNRFFLMIIHKNDRFCCGEPREQKWSQEEISFLSQIWEETEEGISYISYVQLAENMVIVLYQIENMNSKYMITSKIERISRKVSTSLSGIENLEFNILYTDEIQRKEISHAFQKMSRQIRYDVFWKNCCAYALDRLRILENEERISWNLQEQELRRLLDEKTNEVENFIEYLFELVKYPEHNLYALRELIYMLENFSREWESKFGITVRETEEIVYKTDTVQAYYAMRIMEICQEMKNAENNNYSNLVQELMRYMRQNYWKELSLEVLGEEFQMNGVYLGQIFRKETGVTFLKYLTNLRIEEAKRLLEEGEMNVSQVAEKVGYKTSQYFSQIFIKNVGVKPQEYRKWKIRG